MSISKQGYLRQRKKLNPEVFSYLNRKYLLDFYRSQEPVPWHRYLVFAIDGSKAEIPNSEENQKAFGRSGNHHTEGQARVLVSGNIPGISVLMFIDVYIGSAISISNAALSLIRSIRACISGEQITF